MWSTISQFFQIGGLRCGIILSISHTTLSLLFYWPLKSSSLLISDPYTLKGLYIYNIILFSPLVPFIVSLLYSYRFHFSLCYWHWSESLFYHHHLWWVHPALLPSLSIALCPTWVGCWWGIKHVFQREKNKNYTNSWNSRNHAIIMHRDKSLRTFYQRVWLLRTHRKTILILLY